MALQAARMVAWEWDFKGDVVTLSDNAPEVLGVSGTRLVASEVGVSLVHPEDRERHREVIERALRDGGSYRSEFRLLRPDTGATIHAEERGHVVLGLEGPRVVGVLQDVSERRQTGEALRGSEERYRAFIENSTEGIWRLEFDPPIDVTLPTEQQVELAYRNGKMAECNAVMARMYGLGKPEDLIGVSLDAMLPSSDPAARAYLASIIDAGYWVSGVESVERDAAGRTVYFSNSMSGVVEDGRLLRMWGTQRDISVEKRVRREMDEKDAILTAVTNKAPLYIAYCDADARYVYVNRQYAERFGRRVDEVVGKRIPEVLGEAVYESIRANFERALGGENVEFEQSLPFEVWGPRRIRATYAPDTDEATGVVRGVVVVIVDVTQRHDAEQALARQRERLEELVQERTRELEKASQRLRISERLASLGTLSAGLGHDLGNLLIPMRVRLESLAEMSLPDEAVKELGAIRSSTEYLHRLASGLRMLSMDPARSAGSEATEVHAWWREAEPIVRNTLSRGTLLQAKFPEGECWVGMSRAAFTQVVFNLLQNAGDALRGQVGGVVKLEVACHDHGLHLVVEDNGPGMSDEVRRRCLEPFFTTKTRGFSTGLGLPLVLALLQEVGGAIEVESSPGTGTKFTLAVPSAPSAHASSEHPKRVAAVGVRDARVRAFIAAELASLSYGVVGIEQASQADLIVTDAALPEAPVRARTLLIGASAEAPRNPGVIHVAGKIREIRDALREAAKAPEPPPGSAR